MSLEKDSKQTFAVILPAELAKRYEDKNKELGSGRELMFFSFLGYFFLHCQLHIVGFFKNSNKKIPIRKACVLCFFSIYLKKTFQIF